MLKELYLEKTKCVANFEGHYGEITYNGTSGAESVSIHFPYHDINEKIAVKLMCIMLLDASRNIPQKIHDLRYDQATLYIQAGKILAAALNEDSSQPTTSIQD